jgi:hypothetical protein
MNWFIINDKTLHCLETGIELRFKFASGQGYYIHTTSGAGRVKTWSVDQAEFAQLEWENLFFKLTGEHCSLKEKEQINNERPI